MLSANIVSVRLLQDRDQKGERTPRWRGVTLLHELRSHGIPVAIASDNTRDQFYAYGDLDMLEVFNQVPKPISSDRSKYRAGAIVCAAAATTTAAATITTAAACFTTSGL